MPTEAQYFQMVINKTSVLPRMCIRMLATILDDDPYEMVRYVESLGAAFQIQDDLIAIISDDYSLQRGIVGEDIQEGKRTLMVLNTYWNSDNKVSTTSKERLVSILNMRTKDPELIEEAISILK